MGSEDGLPTQGARAGYMFFWLNVEYWPCSPRLGAVVLKSATNCQIYRRRRKSREKSKSLTSSLGVLEFKADMACDQEGQKNRHAAQNLHVKSHACSA
jgi:hypothetical protein